MPSSRFFIIFVVHAGGVQLLHRKRPHLPGRCFSSAPHDAPRSFATDCGRKSMQWWRHARMPSKDAGVPGSATVVISKYEGVLHMSRA